MSLADSFLLTFVSTVICIIFPKIVSSIFAIKSKSTTLSEVTIPVKQVD